MQRTRSTGALKAPLVDESCEIGLVWTIAPWDNLICKTAVGSTCTILICFTVSQRYAAATETNLYDLVPWPVNGQVEEMEWASVSDGVTRNPACLV